MNGWRAEDLLYLRLGTETPNWSLASDSDTLSLGNDQSVAIRLDAVQLMQIRGATGRCVRATMILTVLGAHLRLYLVGLKINDHVWKGMASADVNFLRTAPDPLEVANPANVIKLRKGQRRTAFSCNRRGRLA
jgi:hypothetical protein